MTALPTMTTTQPNVTTHLGGALLIESGTKIFNEPYRVVSPIRDGLRVVVVLAGRMELEAGDAPRLEVHAPTTFAVLSDGENIRHQTFPKHTPFSVVLLQIDRALVEQEFSRDAASLLGERSGFGGKSLVLKSQKANSTVLAIGSQLLADRSLTNNFYRCAKALELVSLVFDSFDIEAAHSSISHLSSSDYDRIRAARDILVQHASDPPDLTALARQCGTNLAKLNRGFRAAYGMAPYRYVQEYRLKKAFEMLATCEFSVGQVALAMGYSSAHFSTLFKRRFGVSPSEMVPNMGDEEILRALTGSPKL